MRGGTHPLAIDKVGTGHDIISGCCAFAYARPSAETMATTRTAILHADDVGMCHGSNAAFIGLARASAIDCVSIMVPCPWFSEIALVAAADRTLDLGVHLTLTSEWIGYR
jgi:hypothetical protein